MFIKNIYSVIAKLIAFSNYKDMEYCFVFYNSDSLLFFFIAKLPHVIKSGGAL